MTVCSKHLSYLLLASLPYFVGCAQKSSASQQNVSSPAPVAQKSIDVVVSPQSVPVNDFADEHLVFKKVLSDDSSSLSISGYNSVQQEDVSFYYN
ncbi:hypothetical protein HY484_01005, partial [Candidatus Woesearchaeota archaeon]|nr:hypothetical protein [Candidatus Woesearchaeota archaeon]